MKYLRQILLIILFSFLGELLHALIPWPVPASIYGMALLFAALWFGILRIEQVKASGSFLVSILSVLFVAPLVNLLDCWALIREHLLSIGLMVFVSTVLCFAVSGLVTQRLVRKEDGHE